MSSELSNNLETKNYTLYLSSSDKISGTNNNATFDINWDDFLPREYNEYKMSFAYQSGGGQYKDLTTTTPYNITQVTNNQVTLTLTSAGLVGVGCLITGQKTLTGTFNATVSGNQMTQIGASAGSVCIGASVTGSGNSTISFTGSIASGTNVLVVTAVAGTILLNMSLSGTGFVGNPTIVSQISGATGGTGSYLISSYQNVPATNITGTLAFSLAGTTITGLVSGSLGNNTAVYSLSKDFSNTINNQVAVTSSFYIDFTTNPTYITAGNTITANASANTFTVSRSINGQTPAGLASFTGTATPPIYSGVKINFNNLSKTYSFDTTGKTQSLTVGYATRDIQTGTSASNSFSTFYLQYPPKTVSRPTMNQVGVQLINVNNGLPLVDTDSAGVPKSDCSNWNLVLEFTPIPESRKKM